MIVEMRTAAQAGRVAGATGWCRLPGSQPGKMSKRLDAGPDFEAHRAAVEPVSVLFRLFDPDGGEVPSGWSVTAARFEVEWPSDPVRAGVVRSHFGARRKAYNWALRQVKADLEARDCPGHESVPWTLDALRKEWNRCKGEVAPWWAENSKECYSSGIADLVEGLSNWSKSKNGKRKGKRVGFPRFRSKRHDVGRVRFTTGAMRLEADRRTIVLPVIGALRSKENTRRVQRRVAKGDARVLSMTLSERWGRLFVAVNYAARTPGRRPVAKPGVRAGVDLGVRTLATVADTQGTIREIPGPAPLKTTLAERRRAGRKLSRRIPGSVGYRQATATLARLDRRVVHLRREAWHQLTHELAAVFSEVVIEDLDIAAMKRSMGRRAFRRAVSDAALGMFRPLLSYKAERTESSVVVADRWYPSSQVHHGCGCRLEGRGKIDKTLVCQHTGERVDRDVNAALNLRDWPDHASCGPVRATAPEDTQARPQAGTDPGSDTRTGAGGVTVRPARKGRPVAVRPKPNQRQRRGGTLQKVPT